MPLILVDLLKKKTDYNAKIKVIEYKIPSVINLATTAALTSVESKIPSVSDLVKKADYDAKISEMQKCKDNTKSYHKFS